MTELEKLALDVEHGEAQVRSSLRRKQKGRHITNWLRAHANPTRLA